MYPQGSYKGMGDIPFIDAFTAVDLANAYNNVSNPANSVTFTNTGGYIQATGTAQTYDMQGTSNPAKDVVGNTQKPPAFNLNDYMLKNQGMLAAVVVGIIALATLKK